MTKEKDTSINYYHISSSNRIKILIPKVSSMAVPSFEDTTIPRVSFAPSIDQCLTALCPSNRILYVYVPDNMETFHIYKPKIYQVRDCKETGKVWSLNKVRAKCIGKIRCYGEIKSLERKCRNYKGTFHIHKFKWEWVEKY